MSETTVRSDLCDHGECARLREALGPFAVAHRSLGTESVDEHERLTFAMYTPPLCACEDTGEWTLSITDVYMSNLAKAAAALGEVRDDER